MAIGDPPASIGDLVAKVRQSAANITKHREAMAGVAAQVKAALPQPPAEPEVKK